MPEPLTGDALLEAWKPWLSSLPRPDIPVVFLTPDQIQRVLDIAPPPGPYDFFRPPVFGTSVVEVDDVEESTPVKLGYPA